MQNKPRKFFGVSVLINVPIIEEIGKNLQLFYYELELQYTSFKIFGKLFEKKLSRFESV